MISKKQMPNVAHDEYEFLWDKFFEKEHQIKVRMKGNIALMPCKKEQSKLKYAMQSMQSDIIKKTISNFGKKLFEPSFEPLVGPRCIKRGRNVNSDENVRVVSQYDCLHLFLIEINKISHLTYEELFKYMRGIIEAACVYVTPYLVLKLICCRIYALKYISASIAIQDKYKPISKIINIYIKYYAIAFNQILPSPPETQKDLSGLFRRSPF